jgi:hypothetical protein
MIRQNAHHPSRTRLAFVTPAYKGSLSAWLEWPVSQSSYRDKRSPRARALSLQWWVRDQHGRVTIAQSPNPALVVWLVAVVVNRMDVLDVDRSATLTVVGDGALLVWALDELARGAAPVRRLLGAVVLAMQIVRLFA